MRSGRVEEQPDETSGRKNGGFQERDGQDGGFGGVAGVEQARGQDQLRRDVVQVRQAERVGSEKRVGE